MMIILSCDMKEMNVKDRQHSVTFHSFQFFCSTMTRRELLTGSAYSVSCIFQNINIARLLLIFVLFLNYFGLCSRNTVEMSPAIFRNINCRNSVYARSVVKRFTVPDEFIFWSTEFPDYKPEFYESDVLSGKPWADPKIGKFIVFYSVMAARQSLGAKSSIEINSKDSSVFRGALGYSSFVF